jgi:hypothetical protein
MIHGCVAEVNPLPWRFGSGRMHVRGINIPECKKAPDELESLHDATSI